MCCIDRLKSQPKAAGRAPRHCDAKNNERRRMETVFEAENNVEAHMIVHLLERSEIAAEIMGEHLQGGVGELPAHGNIRVVVNADDVPDARRLIAEWEAKQRVTPSSPSGEGRENPYTGFIAFLAGAAIASAFLLWAYNSPVSTHTADYNRDGEPDEWVYWRGETASRVEVDRNHDGRVDSKFHYSARNGVETAEFDNDFDGTFEYLSEYRFAQPKFDEIDTNGDEYPDRRYHYANGVLTRIDMYRPSTEIIRKTQIYENGVSLTEARLDSDNDGVLDTVIKYGPFEEEVSRSPISRDQ